MTGHYERELHIAKTGKFQKGKFDILAGMVLTMPAMEHIHPRGEEIKAHKHPWLILATEEDFIEMIMCQTKSCGKEHKNREWKEYICDEVMTVKEPCPPMDPNSERTSYVSLDTYIIVPKKEIFSNPLKIHNRQPSGKLEEATQIQQLCLNKWDLRNILKFARNYQHEHNTPDNEYDPYAILEELDDIENYNDALYKQKFGWRHIKETKIMALKENTPKPQIKKYTSQTNTNQKTLSPSYEELAKAYENLHNDKDHTGLGE